MTRAERRFRQGFRRLVGREPHEVEVRWFLHSPAAEGDPEAEQACREWTLRMHDTLTLQGRK